MNDNSPEKIIENIKTRFNGDNEYDRRIILESMDEYADEEFGPEIVHELSRMLFNYLSPEEIERFQNAFEKAIPEEALLNSVRDDIENEMFDEAFSKLDDYMNDDSRRFINDDKIEYHCFENDMEAVLFEKYYTPKKEVRMIPFNVQIVDLYYTYAYLLVEKNEIEKAEKYLKAALDYDPVSTNVLFELIDIYKKMSDWINMKKYLDLAFTYAQMPYQLARAYRDLGFYHTENGRTDIAVALYIHSLKYDNNQSAYNEINYLDHIGENINITSEEARDILKQNNIPLVANPFIVNEYREYGDKLTENKELEEALQIYTLAYILDDSLENQLRYKMAEAAVNGESNVDITL